MSLNPISWEEQERRKQHRAERRQEKHDLAVEAGLTPDVSIVIESNRPAPMRQQSVKGSAINAEYLKLRKPFLDSHIRCELHQFLARLPELEEFLDGGWPQPPECTGHAVQVHHLVNRSQAREYIADVRNFAATCLHCHGYVTDNPGPAKLVKLTLTVAQVAGFGDDERFLGVARE